MARKSSVLTVLLVCLPVAAAAQNATTPGAVTTPYPTLENLSVEWAIQGDDDLDGVVTVRFRQSGASQWRDAMPLFRVPAGSNAGHSWANKHSGSVLDLSPDTEYEIELSLSDPDGGAETRTVTARTRRVPMASPTGTIKPATPATLDSVLSSAGPGDILVLADGSYDGINVGQDGTETEPIVIRAENPGGAVVNGQVRMDNQAHIHIEGLTIHDQVKFNNAEGIVVRGCTIHTDGYGIISYSNGSTNGYFADNVITGSTGWAEDTVGSSGNNYGEGIQVTGPGNVICYNYVKGFRDAISLMESDDANNQVSVDIYNNDIEVGADDGIEADYCAGNCRIMRNRLTNCFVGASSQPGLGGPTYFVRNVMYNLIYSPFKLHNGTRGDVVLHNTVIKTGDAVRVNTGDTWYRAFFRNNLFIGGEGAGQNGGDGDVARLLSADSSCHFNFDGFGSIGTGRFEGRIGSDNFSNLAELRANTTETDAVEVDMAVFDTAVQFPSSGPFPERSIPVLTLADGSAAVDVGTPLANVNDGYAGTAPDLGAYEAGSTPPHYGPRTATDDVAPAAPTGLTVQ